MAEQKLNITIPQQSLVYLGLCLTGVLIFVFWGIVPAYRTLAELDAKSGIDQTADRGTEDPSAVL